MSRAYDEHLDRLSDVDYEAECGGRSDCSVAGRECLGHSEFQNVIRQRARRYDPNNLLISTTNRQFNNGIY